MATGCLAQALSCRLDPVLLSFSLLDPRFAPDLRVSPEPYMEVGPYFEQCETRQGHRRLAGGFIIAGGLGIIAIGGGGSLLYAQQDNVTFLGALALSSVMFNSVAGGAVATTFGIRQVVRGRPSVCRDPRYRGLTEPEGDDLPERDPSDDDEE